MSNNAQKNYHHGILQDITTQNEAKNLKGIIYFRCPECRYTWDVDERVMIGTDLYCDKCQIKGIEL
jgi:hypothetical protein